MSRLSRIQHANDSASFACWDTWTLLTPEHLQSHEHQTWGWRSHVYLDATHLLPTAARPTWLAGKRRFNETNQGSVPWSAAVCSTWREQIWGASLVMCWTHLSHQNGRCEKRRVVYRGCISVAEVCRHENERLKQQASGRTSCLQRTTHQRTCLLCSSERERATMRTSVSLFINGVGQATSQTNKHQTDQTFGEETCGAKRADHLLLIVGPPPPSFRGKTSDLTEILPLVSRPLCRRPSDTFRRLIW